MKTRGDGDGDCENRVKTRGDGDRTVRMGCEN